MPTCSPPTPRRRRPRVSRSGMRRMPPSGVRDCVLSGRSGGMWTITATVRLGVPSECRTPALISSTTSPTAAPSASATTLLPAPDFAFAEFLHETTLW